MHITKIRALAPVSLTAASLAAALLLLAGCGGTSHQPQVASLSTHGTGSSSHRSAAVTVNSGVPDPDGRPRAPLNATPKQFAALYDPYFGCLRAHKFIDAIGNKAQLAVAAKCEKLDPLPAWQFDPSNPQARAFIGRTVSCMEARGYRARAVLYPSIPDAAATWAVAYSPKDVITEHRTTVAQNACQQQALR
jgi:hypothetical protein